MRLLQEEEELGHTDTEITLGMRSLLGVFFGLVLICGVFFGLGYSLGRGSAKPVAPGPSEAAKPTTRMPIGPTVHENDGSESSPYTPGPDAREPINASAAEPAPTSAPKPSGTVVKQLSPDNEEQPVAAPLRKPTPAVTSAETETSASKPAPASTSNTPAATPAAAAATGTSFMVQVAAISRQEDAEILVAALNKRGYSAVIRNDPKDSLLHVQIGPFATRDEARAMRTKLLGDGYNAILK
jgi:DedD protein